MKIAAIIPARGGSKSIKKKNITKLNGMPLIEYTLKAAEQSNLISEIIVATEDKEIASVCVGYNTKIFWRSEKTCHDESLTQELLKEIYLKMPAIQSFDRIVLLQPTSPLRTHIHIDQALNLSLKKVGENATVVSVQEVPHQFNPEQVFEINEVSEVIPNKLDQFKRRQDKPLYFARNGAAIYIFQPLKMTTDILSGQVIGYKMDKLSSIDIDDLEDLRIAEAIIKNAS